MFKNKKVWYRGTDMNIGGGRDRTLGIVRRYLDAVHLG